MKKFTSMILAIIFSMMASAQDSKDPVYGFGAVTTQNGKVVFERSISCGSATQEAVYQAASAWAKGRYVAPVVVSGRVSENPNDEISIKANEIIVFKKTNWITDESNIRYSLTISLSDGKCSLKFSEIDYVYEEDRDGGGQHFTAEEWITDEEAFNRKGTKMLPATGKFRMKTIDLVNQITSDLESAIKAFTTAGN